MFKKQALIWLSVILLVCLVFTFAACAKTYTVTYDKGDIAATGTAPETKSYKQGDTVTVADNTFAEESGKYVFDGWVADGSETVYQAGDTFVMPDKNVNLTAKWAKAYNGNKLVTVADVLAAISDEDTSAIEYKHYVAGTVKSIDNATFGQMTLQDETGEIMVYGTQSADGKLRYDAMTEKPVKGDYVVLFIQDIQNFQGKTKEIHSAWIVYFEQAEQPPVNPDDYPRANISEARAKSVGDKVSVEGVVARITYATGMKPNGFFLIDGTDSIYVYDSQVAPQVAIGDKVRVAAVRDNWILQDEQSYAQKLGYTGCIQLTEAQLVKKIASAQAVDYSWVRESTVKKIMDTPLSENITTTVFKVNALIKKSVGSGFINYYFDDIDGVTGSYAYTQCNGGDYAWLDEFDGKICTVYLSVINAKSTATGGVWRFVPIQVSYDNYQFHEKDAPQFALDYYATAQFKSVYQSDPSLEVVTAVNSELLGITDDIVITYSSDNTQSVQFQTSQGVTVMHTLKPGTANITVKATYKTYSAQTTVVVKVEEKSDYSTLTVAQAIDADVDTEVTVRGIVGPSLVNQKSGFYLIDETGVIAVRLTSADQLKELSLGDEIVLKATRAIVKPGEKYFGQSCLDNAEVLQNEYGDHEYSTASFITGKTVDDLFKTDVLQDHGAEVYIVNAKIEIEIGQHSEKVKLVGDNYSLELYCSGAKQYAFLQPYDGQTVTVEVALCNWNGKTFYKGCVLSVTGADGVKVFNRLNFAD